MKAGDIFEFLINPQFEGFEGELCRSYLDILAQYELIEPNKIRIFINEETDPWLGIVFQDKHAIIEDGWEIRESEKNIKFKYYKTPKEFLDKSGLADMIENYFHSFDRIWKRKNESNTSTN